MNLQLEYMKKALAAVQGVSTSSAPIRKTYGALCHQIPILVLTNGLGLTAAFVEAKAASEEPYRLIKEHLAGVLGAGPNVNLSTHIKGRTSEEYMLDTFTILDAWVYYKRFAVSLLGVEAGTVDTVREDQTEGE